MQSARSNRKIVIQETAEGQEEVTCLDMEVVVGDEKFIITIFEDSDLDSLAL